MHLAIPYYVWTTMDALVLSSKQMETKRKGLYLRVVAGASHAGPRAHSHSEDDIF